MKLPSDAIIEAAKIRDYLLSERKRNDKSKWLAEAGYSQNNWQRLEMDLRTQILSLDAIPIDQTKYGQTFDIKGILKGPNGKKLKAHSVWMTEFESKSTKFITMFPDKE